MKKKILIPIIALLLCFFSVSSYFVFFHDYNKINNPKLGNEAFDIITLIDESNYAFIGEINNIEYTDNEVIYDITVIDYLKGCSFKNIKVYYNYGYLDTPITKNEIDTFIVKGKCYLIFAQKKGKDTLVNSYFTLASEKHKILLEEYDVSKSFTEQSLHIQYTINKYKNIIDKKVYGKDKINIVEFATLQHMYDYYDYVIKIAIVDSIFMKTSTNEKSLFIDGNYFENEYGVNGYGSDTFTLIRGYTAYEFLKGNRKDVKLNILYEIGVDVYFNGEGKEMTKQGEYLIFANTERNSEIESACIPDDGLIITSNSQLININDLTEEDLNFLENYSKNN